MGLRGRWKLRLRLLRNLLAARSTNASTRTSGSFGLPTDAACTTGLTLMDLGAPSANMPSAFLRSRWMARRSGAFRGSAGPSGAISGGRNAGAAARLETAAATGC